MKSKESVQSGGMIDGLLSEIEKELTLLGKEVEEKEGRVVTITENIKDYIEEIKSIINK
jgi:hypothetical protein